MFIDPVYETSLKVPVFLFYFLFRDDGVDGIVLEVVQFIWNVSLKVTAAGPTLLSAVTRMVFPLFFNLLSIPS